MAAPYPGQYDVPPCDYCGSMCVTVDDGIPLCTFHAGFGGFGAAP